MDIDKVLSVPLCVAPLLVGTSIVNSLLSVTIISRVVRVVRVVVDNASKLEKALENLIAS